VIISWQCFSNSILFDSLSLRPYRIAKGSQLYRIITHAFVHVNWEHLLFNMISFVFMGLSVERICQFYYNKWAIPVYLFIYFGAIIFSSIYALITKRKSSSYSAVGASGAVTAVVFSFILFQPLEKLYLMGIPIGIPAILFGIIFIAASLYLAKKNNDPIAHDAHIGGALWGFICPIIIKPALFSIFISQLGL
jgi:membrane associated rhomboid family serine protease